MTGNLEKLIFTYRRPTPANTKYMYNIYEGFYNFKHQHCPHLVIFIFEYFGAIIYFYNIAINVFFERNIM